MAFNIHPVLRWLATVPIYLGDDCEYQLRPELRKRTIDQGLTESERAVLKTFAAFTNETSGLTFPPIGLVARIDGRSERHVTRVVRMLEHLGVMTLEKRSTRRDPAMYALHFPNSRPDTKVSPLRNSRPDTEGGPDLTPKQSRPDTRVS